MEDPRSKTVQVFCVATADTKLNELRFLSESVRSNINRFSSPTSQFQVEVTVIDVSVGPKETEKIEGFNFIPRKDVLSCYLESAESSLPDDRGKAMSVMANSLANFLKKACIGGFIGGAIGLGGSGGTSMLSSAFKVLPIGIPKMIVSTIASGNTGSYIGTSDLVLLPSVVDICGLNTVSRVVFSNAGAAFAGMVVGSLDRLQANVVSDGKGVVGITMFGVTTPCVSSVRKRLEDEGYETPVFHATGVGGRAMEDLVNLTMCCFQLKDFEIQLWLIQIKYTTEYFGIILCVPHCCVVCKYFLLSFHTFVSLC